MKKAVSFFLCCCILSLIVKFCIDISVSREVQSLPENEILVTHRINSEYITLRRQNGDYEDFKLTVHKAGEWPPVFIVRDGEIIAITADMVQLPPVVTPEEKAKNSEKAMKAAEDYGPGW